MLFRSALTRPLDEVRRTAARVGVALAPALPDFAVEVVECAAEIGSGAQPGRDIASAAVAIRPRATRGRGHALQHLSDRFRALPIPVIGRIRDDAYLLDCRGLADEQEVESFIAQLGMLVPSGLR